MRNANELSYNFISGLYIALDEACEQEVVGQKHTYTVATDTPLSRANGSTSYGCWAFRGLPPWSG